MIKIFRTQAPPHQTSQICGVTVHRGPRLTQIFFSISDPRSARHTHHDLGELLTVVAIDGKTSRRMGSKTKAEAGPLHQVSAFAAGMGVVLGQMATAGKSYEITAIQELLAKLALEGCVVMIDTMGTQTKIARSIRKRGAHYVLCINENHPNLYDSILFGGIDPRAPLTPRSTHESTIKDSGRTEVRRCRAYEGGNRLYKSDAWQDLPSFAVLERKRTVGGHTSTKRVFYISSLPADAVRMAQAVRSHWEVENRLHWCLDVRFNEDKSHVHSGYAANNQAIVRHAVMSPQRLNTARKASIKSKRKLAATIEAFRAHLLNF